MESTRSPDVAEAVARPSQHEVTRLLDAWQSGEPRALDSLLPLVEAELHRVARGYMSRQDPGHTLQPTALVHEAVLRLVGRSHASWHDREHFFAYMAATMRRILINHARDRAAAKRGGLAAHMSLDTLVEAPGELPVDGPEAGRHARPASADLLDLDRALQQLSALDERQSRIVELRYFGGLTVEETASVLDLSARTVKREWHSARLWLLRALSREATAF